MNLITIGGGRTRAAIAPEAGGRLVQFEVLSGQDWHPVLVAPNNLQELLAEPLLWGSYPMAPWPGRVDGARFAWRGSEHSLPASDGHHSIHGRAVYFPWTLTERRDDYCILNCELGAARGWPFQTRVRQEIRAADDGLFMSLAVENLDRRPFPAGLGWHPWFRRAVLEEEARVLFRAAFTYKTRPDLIPTGVVREPQGDEDFAAGERVSARRIDAAFGGVTQPVEITWGDLGLSIESGPNCDFAVVYTDSERGFCVEPQTCAPDAFNLASAGKGATGVVEILPGASFSAFTKWTWRRPG